MIARKELRPHIDDVMPERMELLVRECWCDDQHARPNFESVLYALGEMEMEQTGRNLSREVSMSPTDRHRSLKLKVIAMRECVSLFVVVLMELVGEMGVANERGKEREYSEC